MEGTWPSGARTLVCVHCKTRTVRVSKTSNGTLGSSADRASEEIARWRKKNVCTARIRYRPSIVRAPLGQVPSTLRHSRDKFYQASSFSCVQHWKIKRSLGTRLMKAFVEGKDHGCENMCVRAPHVPHCCPMIADTSPADKGSGLPEICPWLDRGVLGEEVYFYCLTVRAITDRKWVFDITGYLKCQRVMTL